MAYLGRTVIEDLHLHSNSFALRKAKKLRQNQTTAESILWGELKNRKCVNLKFRRQHPILSFIADFYCHEKKLIVEVDGPIHDDEATHERDEIRSHELDRQGITVIRFTNDEILKHLDKVLDTIAEKVRTM
jgi:very-short-patch-repair endonuclease